MKYKEKIKKIFDDLLKNVAIDSIFLIFSIYGIIIFKQP